MSGPTCEEIYLATLPGYFWNISPDVVQELRSTIFTVVPQSESPGLFYVAYNIDALNRLMNEAEGMEHDV